MITSEHLIAGLLANGSVGVLPTDTIYGIVGSALRKDTVERIYALRRRERNKPMIVLIASAAELKRFGVAPRAPAKRVLEKVWPGKVSVILPCTSKKFAYLHRGTKTLAFRVPSSARLRALLAKTGPLVAPSANIEGEAPSRTIAEAKRYFGDRVEFYTHGRTSSAPSTLINIDRKGQVTVLRQGAARVRIS